MPEKAPSSPTEVSSVLSIRQLESFFSRLRNKSFALPMNQNRIDLSELGLSGLALYSIYNLGDPYQEGSFQIESKAYEREVIDYIASLYELYDEPWGYISNGIGEANLFSLYMGRDFLEGKSRHNLHNGAIKPILFFSKSSHYSIHRTAKILNLQYRVINVDARGGISLSDLEQAINQYQYRPMLFVLNMGTAFSGATDDLQEVNNLLQKYNVSDFFIHCDAALSGMIQPFADKTLSTSFEKGINSIVIAADKFLGSPIPSAIVVTRKEYTQYIQNDREVTDSTDITISGTRYGLAALAIWYILQEKKDRLEEEVKQCLDKARYLIHLLREQHYPCYINDTSITVVFKKPLSRKFIENHQLYTRDGWAHVETLPHVTNEQLTLFVEELVESEEQARRDCQLNEQQPE